eukprot:TRINITY_DN20144_c0_g1_i1.p1 TRINITY_DN20144_c0_g1~~TRINITY_DN20144_c0_g1_i1.p1  ORF type:complete len:162 (-),score=20.66 TRINITY_DN20144_c0_g1_i1:52-504(-)
MSKPYQPAQPYQEQQPPQQQQAVYGQQYPSPQPQVVYTQPVQGYQEQQYGTPVSYQQGGAPSYDHGQQQKSYIVATHHHHGSDDSTWEVLAYVFGIISFFFCPIICGPIGCIFAANIKDKRRKNRALIIVSALAIIGLILAVILWAVVYE